MCRRGFSRSGCRNRCRRWKPLAPGRERAKIRARDLNGSPATSRGTFALVDYVNFKGEGTKETERYRNEGWELLQVLEYGRIEKRAIPRERLPNPPQRCLIGACETLLPERHEEGAGCRDGKVASGPTGWPLSGPRGRQVTNDEGFSAAMR